MKGFIAIIQLVLHYLGIFGIVLGVIAYIFSNPSRGKELLIGGVSFLILKYLIGFAYLGLIGIVKLVRGRRG